LKKRVKRVEKESKVESLIVGRKDEEIKDEEIKDEEIKDEEIKDEK
jgi:hypothetical protein